MIRLVSGVSVVGYSRSVFQREGQQVAGYMINFTFPLSAEGSRGDGVGSVWVSQAWFNSNVVDIGSSIDVARVRSGDRFKYQLVG